MFRVGDKVKVVRKFTSEINKIEWAYEMSKTIGKVGYIVEIDIDNLCRIYFGESLGEYWYGNKKLLKERFIQLVDEDQIQLCCDDAEKLYKDILYDNLKLGTVHHISGNLPVRRLLTDEVGVLHWKEPDESRIDAVFLHRKNDGCLYYDNVSNTEIFSEITWEEYGKSFLKNK